MGSRVPEDDAVVASDRRKPWTTAGFPICLHAPTDGRSNGIVAAR